MAVRLALLVVLVAALVAVSVAFAPQLLGRPSATPAPPATASATATASLAAASPTPTATASPTPTPTRTPTASCPPAPAGGGGGPFHPLKGVRVDHQPGADRVVFDFGTETGPQDALPAFTIERAASFRDISGKAVTVQGNAYWSVRFEGASTADSQGNLVYTGPRDILPTTPLVKDVKLVEDFESVLIWAVGLQRLECPAVTTLRSPLRLVLDFPSPP